MAMGRVPRSTNAGSAGAKFRRMGIFALSRSL